MKTILYTLALVGALLLTGCANAGKDQTVMSGEHVTLDGAASTASLRGELHTYHWTQIQGAAVTLSGEDSVQATFTAPTVTQSTQLVFRLKTVETGGRISPFVSFDTVVITVNPRPNPNQSPHAAATASSHIIEEGERVTFDASGSQDPDGQIVAYKWVNASGETLSTAAHFTQVFAQAGDDVVTLEVTDDDGATDQVSLVITVVVPADTTAPVITLRGEANVCDLECRRGLCGCRCDGYG